MKKKMILARLSLALLFGIAIWRTSEGARPDANETGPSRNLSPRHVVRISGRLPKHLNIKLVADYETTANSESCWKNTNEWWGGDRRRVREVLDIRRAGNRYETSLVIDKYEPGECRWRYLVSNVAVTKTEEQKDIDATVGEIIDGTKYSIDDSAPRCPTYSLRCSEERTRRLSNANDTPVLVRCQTLPPGETPWSGPYKAQFTCQDPENDSYKKEHFVIPGTKYIQLDFYDIDSEPDPITELITKE